MLYRRGSSFVDLWEKAASLSESGCNLFLCDAWLFSDSLGLFLCRLFLGVSNRHALGDNIAIHPPADHFFRCVPHFHTEISENLIIRASNCYYYPNDSFVFPLLGFFVYDLSAGPLPLGNNKLAYSLMPINWSLRLATRNSGIM